MIKSMTGYGSSKGIKAGFEISVELKSVNNRYLETSVHLPRSIIFAEEAVKSLVAAHISRGKVDIFISMTAKDADDVAVRINESLLKGYLSAVGEIADKYNLTGEISAKEAARMPDVLTVERAETDRDEICEGLCEIAEEALKDYDSMRAREGEKLKEDILSKLGKIYSYVERIEQESPKTVEAYRTRLETKLKEVLEDRSLDESRIIQEAAIFADRIAVDEETVRLRSHMEQLRTMLETGSPIGRKIDFLVQEFNREANTIGSKCQNSGIAHMVVDLKSEIEKIREQVQNIE